jgi:hypothetical protein
MLIASGMTVAFPPPEQIDLIARQLDPSAATSRIDG